MTTIHKWHPAAAAFPLMQGDEFRQFVEDIKANEVRKPIEVYDGERFAEYRGYGIDGRNRHAACLTLGIEPPLKTLTDADLGASQSLTAYIVSVNVARRHLTSSQAAIVGVEIKRQLQAEAHQRQVAHLKRGDDSPDLQNVRELKKSSPTKAQDFSAYLFFVRCRRSSRLTPSGLLEE